MQRKQDSSASATWLASALLGLACCGCGAPAYHLFHYHTPFAAVARSNKTYYHSQHSGKIIPKHTCGQYCEPGCYGYEPTCWTRWPADCPGTCPVEGEIIWEEPVDSPVGEPIEENGVVTNTQPSQPHIVELADIEPAGSIPLPTEHMVSSPEDAKPMTDSVITQASNIDFPESPSVRAIEVEATAELSTNVLVPQRSSRRNHLDDVPQNKGPFDPSATKTDSAKPGGSRIATAPMANRQKALTGGKRAESTNPPVIEPTWRPSERLHNVVTGHDSQGKAELSARVNNTKPARGTGRNTSLAADRVKSTNAAQAPGTPAISTKPISDGLTGTQPFTGLAAVVKSDQRETSGVASARSKSKDFKAPRAAASSIRFAPADDIGSKETVRLGARERDTVLRFR